MLFGSYIGPWPYPQNYLNPPVVNKMQQMVEQLLAAERICAIINIQNFIKHVAELYAGPNHNAETDEEVVEQP